MLRVLDCLTQQHDYHLVILALGVCALGSYAAITLLNHVRVAQGRSRWGWLAATAVANGFSIWATHFIAMLAFSPDGPTGYDLVLTLLSLVAAIAVTGFAYFTAIDGGLPMRALGGVLVGGGIATMHYTGMAAFNIAGFIVWDENSGRGVDRTWLRVGCSRVGRRSRQHDIAPPSPGCASPHARDLQSPLHCNGGSINRARSHDNGGWVRHTAGFDGGRRRDGGSRHTDADAGWCWARPTGPATDSRLCSRYRRSEEGGRAAKSADRRARSSCQKCARLCRRGRAALARKQLLDGSVPRGP